MTLSDTSIYKDNSTEQINTNEFYTWDKIKEIIVKHMYGWPVDDPKGYVLTRDPNGVFIEEVPGYKFPEVPAEVFYE